MQRLRCDQCDKDIIPVEGVTAVFSRGSWWCARHADITFIDGEPVVAFPSDGKLCRSTLMTEEARNADD